MRIGAKVSVIVSACLLSLALLTCRPAHGQHWTPPTPTNYWQTVWGYIFNYDTIAAGDEVWAFRVDNDQSAGWTTVSWNGSNFGFNMIVWAPDSTPFDVYFYLWDGASEISAGPDTTAYPAYLGSGDVQHHDLNGQAGVPEPPTIALGALSLLIVWLFLLKGSLPFLRTRTGSGRC